MPRLRALLASLLVGGATLGPGPAPGGAPARAAELLQVRLGDLQLPLNLQQLQIWSQDPSAAVARSATDDDLALWLDLLEPEARRNLRQLLRSPLLRDRSFSQQLLSSWAGERMLAEVGALMTGPDGSSTAPLLQRTLRRGLEHRGEVTTLELLRDLPVPVLTLQLDGLLAMGQRWRRELDRQTRAFQALPDQGLPARQLGRRAGLAGAPRRPQRLWLSVPHRGELLPLSLWLPPRSARPAPPGRPWLLLMPGLGGTAEQLSWLAAGLAGRGWPGLVLQHPGSDEAALRASLDGDRPPPGAESLPQRQADIRAVLAAQSKGQIPGLAAGSPVVLVGHSLGAVAALLAAGLPPEPDLEGRCRQAIERLPISNPSQLLQCQLASVPLPPPEPAPTGLRAVVLLNGFGSLLWPRRGLAGLPVPALVVGGSLDLVTPPLREQLDLFSPPANPANRLALVQGGSHFSPVRLDPGDGALFRLGDELVGVEPARVQEALLSLMEEFLDGLQPPATLVPQRRRQAGVTTWVLDAESAGRWRRSLSE
ncbi:MAG: alpha/beta hydrolase [Cyanobacteriota bacterium]|nr:alpha/beta hydrolase [Cyanobacteriota bacterium]